MPRSFLVKKPERTRHNTSARFQSDHLVNNRDFPTLKDDEKPTYCDPYCAVPGMCGPHHGAVSVTAEPGVTSVVTPYTPILHPLAVRLSHSKFIFTIWLHNMSQIY